MHVDKAENSGNLTEGLERWRRDSAGVTLRIELRICIGCDVLEKGEDVMGRTRDQRWVCGAGGRRGG